MIGGDGRQAGGGDGAFVDDGSREFAVRKDTRSSSAKLEFLGVKC